MKLSVSFVAFLLIGFGQAWSSPSNNNKSNQAVTNDRRSFVSSLIVGGTTLLTQSTSVHAQEEESFASIAARASKISQAMVEQEEKTPTTPTTTADGRTAYDFTLPMQGQPVPIRNIVRNEDNKVKAILFVNIKQDDPVARKDIPEFISLAAKYVH